MRRESTMYQPEIGKMLAKKRAKDKGNSFHYHLSHPVVGWQDWRPKPQVEGSLAWHSTDATAFLQQRADAAFVATPRGWGRLSSPLTNEMSFVGTLADRAAARMSRQQTHEMKSSG